jgi:hypothetical protein
MASPYAHPAGSTVVYSGPGNEERARERAEALGSGSASRIDDTQAGAQVQRGALVQTTHHEHGETIYQQRLHAGDNPREASVQTEFECEQIVLQRGREASRQYAREAEGDVNTYVCGSRPTSTYRSTEQPELLANEKVTSINGVPREELAKMDKDEAHAAICRAELERDRAIARGVSDPDRREALEYDVERRENQFRGQQRFEIEERKSSAELTERQADAGRNSHAEVESGRHR